VPVPDDLAAFCEVQRPRLVGMLGLHCGDAQVAEELAQDAIAKACERWPKVRRMEFPEAWIWRVALNLATSYFRRKAAERKASRRLQALPVETVADPSSSWAAEVRRAVASLPPRQRSALVLRYYIDLSIAQTAQIMDCSEGTVKALTHKAEAALRGHPCLAELRDVADA
jgi:RNA polymerase sigma-70 factor (sigma-E family)